jgi:hypothetical protein
MLGHPGERVAGPDEVVIIPTVVLEKVSARDFHGRLKPLRT